MISAGSSDFVHWRLGNPYCPNKFYSVVSIDMGSLLRAPTEEPAMLLYQYLKSISFPYSKARSHFQQHPSSTLRLRCTYPSELIHQPHTVSNEITGRVKMGGGVWEVGVELCCHGYQTVLLFIILLWSIKFHLSFWGRAGNILINRTQTDNTQL